jgi:hypothetical protein
MPNKRDKLKIKTKHHNPRCGAYSTSFAFWQQERPDDYEEAMRMAEIFVLTEQKRKEKWKS